MKRRIFMVLCFLIVIFSQSHKTARTESPWYNMGAVLPDSSELAVDYLKTTMDAFHNTLDIYTDLGAAGNHFNAPGMMPDETAAVSMDQCCTENPLSGSTCIQCTFQSQWYNYGGYYFLNGTLTGDETKPQCNWGDIPDAGFDLSGATSITFYARGETGGERVEFIVGGVGWAVDSQGNSTFPEQPYPDSFPKLRTGTITLTSQWEQYSIDLQGNDLSYVLSGFGWVATAVDNNHQNITFYLDDIYWNKPRLEELRLLLSYETNPTQEEDFDVVMRNVAFSYDNALALLVFLARGTEDDLSRAAVLADSFVHAIHNDRYYTGIWLRNGYMAGDLKQFPGWTPNNNENTARMPGFWNCEDDSWYEDNFQISTHTGNVGWVIIALLSSYQVLGDSDYLQAAQELGEWVEIHCKDNRGNGGYTGGYEGWEPETETLLYKSTEHNLDLYVAFYRLFEITSDETWLQRAVHAEIFVKSMWDETEGKFYTGTDDTGITINQEVIPLDAQTWAIMVFRDEQDLYLRALEYAEAHHRVDNGFDFNTDQDGIWYEGTAQMAVAYQAVGETGKAATLVTAVEDAQFENGAIPAASKDGLTTGFYLPDNSPWLYYQRGHVGASSWYLFAKLGVNPYWIGAETSEPTLTVTSPNGGESWEIGSQHTITWNSSGSVGNVDIEYSTNNGESWIEIATGTPNDGSRLWTVPDTVSNQCLIRVFEPDGSPVDTSDDVFSITPPPTITVTSPNGGERWLVGTWQTITWTCEGNVETVMIECSFNGGTAWKTIAVSTENDGQFIWKIPNQPSDNCLIRVSASDVDEGPADVSDEVFAIFSPITAAITVNSPNGGESWGAGSSQEIKWNSSGDISNVTIKYSIDNGTTWKTIVQTTANDGSYNWVVPGTVSDQCLVQVTGNDSDLDPKPSDVSDEVFSIVSPITAAITVNSPNGGESWVTGSSQEIKWTSTGDINNVTIKYSTDNGTTWKTIVQTTANDGSFNWNVPGTASDECLVQVIGNDNDLDPNPSDVSDGVFSIVLSSPPTITVTAPNGGEQLLVGSWFDITWFSNGTREEVKIEYSVNSGQTWTEITGAAENNGSYDWTVPDTPSETCLVRVSEIDGQPEDVSDAVFSIVSPLPDGIIVKSPNGGESWTVGSLQEITWIGSGDINNVTIEYSYDNGITWKVIVQTTTNDGSYDWTVPDTVSDECLVRVTAIDGAGDPRPSDVSDKVFSIVLPPPPIITVTAPNGGEQLVVGSRFDITWFSSEAGEKVLIEYSVTGGETWPVITDATENDGHYDWIVPDEPSETCLVRISEIDGRLIDISDAVFSIVSPQPFDITIISPNGGENWTAGSWQEIKWTSTGDINNVTIEYSADNGTTWKVIVQTTPNDGSCDWTVPDTVSDECLVRVTANDNDLDPKPWDVSDEVFSIVSSSPGAFRVTSPNGGEDWEVGSVQTITWDRVGDIGSVKIDYSFDNGSTWKTVVSSTNNSGSYNWLLPDTVSDECLVRITANDGGGEPKPSDVSDEVFSIVRPSEPFIKVISPNGGEQLVVGSRFPITWYATDSREEVKIEYSINGGETWTVITGATENDGEYDWIVAGETSEICLVRISEIDGQPLDVSDAVFSIVFPTPGIITVISPNGGENWVANSSQEIKWTCSGDINNVFIEYSTDNGTTWKAIVKTTPNDGSYDWTAADTVSDDCLVRVTANDDDLDPKPWDISDEVFSIVSALPGAVRITSPNGGEEWEVASIQPITWTSTGNISSVKIDYSPDNGNTWSTIVSSANNSGSYNWLVPDTVSEECLVRITGDDGGGDPKPSDVSDEVFSIVRPSEPFIKVISPNGGEELPVGSRFNITWYATDSREDVTIAYSSNGGETWTGINESTPNSGNFDWIIPDDPSDNCLVRISEIDGEPVDVSDAVFSIVSPSGDIKVISPNGGENLEAGYEYVITWESSGVDNVVIKYSIDNGVTWTTIGTAPAAEGIYTWLVPETPSETCRVQVTAIDAALDPRPSDMSDQVFSIVLPYSGAIRVDSPNGGETLTAGAEYDITWTSTDVNNVIIEYSIDNGAEWISIDTVAAGDGRYTWTVPQTPSQTCLVRISGNTPGEDPFDVSDSVFSII